MNAGVLAIALFATNLGQAELVRSDDVFAGPTADYATPLAPASADPSAPLRTLVVEERGGTARQGDLVRAPIFFVAGECTSIDELAIVAREAPNQPVPLQADDIRKGPDGGVSRVHLWFPADLAPGQRRTFLLVRRSAAHGAAATPVPARRDGAGLKITTNLGEYAFSGEGGLVQLPRAAGAWKFSAPGARPDIAGLPAPANAIPPASAAARAVWSTGPLFAKVRVTLPFAAAGSVEQEFRIPRDGREAIVSTSIFPGEGSGTVKRNRLLVGRLEAATPPTIVKVPAGIRYSLRAEHAYTVSALSDAAAHAALLAVPLVLGGTNGQWSAEPDGQIVLEGQRGLVRGGEGEKGTLYGYWTEVRLVPVRDDSPDALWRAYRERVQPLVAIVEEPGATTERLHDALSALAGEMKPVGWRQDAARSLVFGHTRDVERILSKVSLAKEGDAESLVRGAQADTAKLTQDGKRKLREDEKGRAYGRLDPYHITYTQSAAAAVAAFTDAPAVLTDIDYAMAKAAREFGGKTDQWGLPYIDCFSRTLNMQMGPVLFGITAGAKRDDHALVEYYRDLATAPPTLAVFGRGQRPYTGAPAGSADQTDYLYQSICDFWLRTTELLADENLQLHPLAYGRYVDCVDVMADRYHGLAAKDKPNTAGQARANFFRGQVHTHRWLGWSASPYIRLLENPSERASVGLTEAIRYSEMMKGRWKNWPDLTFYAFADLLIRFGLQHDESPALPAAPTHLVIDRRDGAAELRWDPVTRATGYRVFRATRPGGPYTWLNSPYAADAQPVTEPHFRDATASADSNYVVLAVDSAGRASAWLDWPVAVR